jgi:hypothetical protein
MQLEPPEAQTFTEVARARLACQSCRPVRSAPSRLAAFADRLGTPDGGGCRYGEPGARRQTDYN